MLCISATAVAAGNTPERGQLLRLRPILRSSLRLQSLQRRAESTEWQAQEVVGEARKREAVLEQQPLIRQRRTEAVVDSELRASFDVLPTPASRCDALKRGEMDAKCVLHNNAHARTTCPLYYF